MNLQADFFPYDLGGILAKAVELEDEEMLQIVMDEYEMRQFSRMFKNRKPVPFRKLGRRDDVPEEEEQLRLPDLAKLVTEEWERNGTVRPSVIYLSHMSRDAVPTKEDVMEFKSILDSSKSRPPFFVMGSYLAEKKSSPREQEPPEWSQQNFQEWMQYDDRTEEPQPRPDFREEFWRHLCVEQAPVKAPLRKDSDQLSTFLARISDDVKLVSTYQLQMRLLKELRLHGVNDVTLIEDAQSKYPWPIEEAESAVLGTSYLPPLGATLLDGLPNHPHTPARLAGHAVRLHYHHLHQRRTPTRSFHTSTTGSYHTTTTNPSTVSRPDTTSTSSNPETSSVGEGSAGGKPSDTDSQNRGKKRSSDRRPISRTFPAGNLNLLNLDSSLLQEAIEHLNEIHKPDPVTQYESGFVREDEDSEEDEEMYQEILQSVVAPGDLHVKFSDIGALSEQKQALRELVALPLKHPHLFTRGNLKKATKGVLLFGPPGTGKTLLAKAVAAESGANFLEIRASTLTSKWFGESEKRVKALFHVARSMVPVVLFLDEVDGLLSRRESIDHDATRRIKNEFMAAWDGLRSTDTERLIILAATNRPQDLDDAVLRRLPKRLLVDMPDFEARLRILETLLKDETISFEEFGSREAFIHELATITSSYTGSDLRNLCIAAAYLPLREVVPLLQNDPAPDMRPVSIDDFKTAMTQVRPSVNEESPAIRQLREWNAMYGDSTTGVTKTRLGF